MIVKLTVKVALGKDKVVNWLIKENHILKNLFLM